MLIGAAALAALGVLSFRPVARELVYPLERLKLAFKRKVANNPEVSRLKREKEFLELAMEDMAELKAENLRLRRALGYAEANEKLYVAAAVLSSGGAAAGNCKTIRADKGSLAGVREGAYAVTPDGLVGRVTATSPHTSDIALITDPHVKVSVYAELPGGGHAHGILSGGSEDILHLRYLNGGEQPTAHSRILTSGLGGVFPPGLAIGTLISGEGEVRPAVDFATLEDVFIRCEK